MTENKISKLEERKKLLEEQIKKEKEKELLKFSKWFFKKFDVDTDKEAREIVSMFDNTDENEDTEIDKDSE